MKLAPTLNAQMNALAEQPDTAGALREFRAANRALLAQKPLPEAFAETWKYTKLHQLTAGQLEAESVPGVAPTEVPVFGCEPLIIVNGRLPDTLPHWEGVSLTRLEATTPQALADTTFALLNGATLKEGLHISVAKGATPSELFHIIFYTSGCAPAHHNTRLLVELGENSRLNLIEHYMGSGPLLSNSVTEIDAGANSELQHIRLQSEADDCLHIGQLAIRQQASSRVTSHQFMTGATLRRNDVHVMIEGEGAELTMGGAFIARGRGHIDNQVCVEHRVPHCVSNQDFKGIAGDKGRIIFNGRIHILPGASQTNADLTNKNLLLNLGAEIDSKPELEIYNDDVKCSHGTTIGQLDPTMRFYLQSRGIDAEAAQRMLSLGFIQEQLNDLPFDALGDWISQWLGHAVTEQSDV